MVVIGGVVMYVKEKNDELGMSLGFLCIPRYTENNLYPYSGLESQTMIALFLIHPRSNFRGSCDGPYSEP